MARKVSLAAMLQDIAARAIDALIADKQNLLRFAREHDAPQARQEVILQRIADLQQARALVK